MSPPDLAPNKEVELFCPCCQWKAPDIVALRFHLYDHSENLTCPLCHMKYGSIIMLTKHFALHCSTESGTDELGREVCYLCRSCNTQVHGLQYHLLDQHPDPEKDVVITKFTFEPDGTVKEQYITHAQIRALRDVAPVVAPVQPKSKPPSPPDLAVAGPSGVVWPKKPKQITYSDDDDSDDDTVVKERLPGNQLPLELIPISVPKQDPPTTRGPLQKPVGGAEEYVPSVGLTVSPPPSRTPPPQAYQDLPHSPPRTYISCEFCKCAFRRLRHYDAHVRTAHKKENAGNPWKPLQMNTFTVDRYYDPQVCPICEEHLFSTDSFNMHVIGHLPDLRREISEHTQAGGDAASATGTVEDDDQTQASSHGDGTSSDGAPSEAYYVAVAKKEEDPEIGLKCYICNQKFRGTKGVRIHLLKIHKQDVPYICPVCGVECFSYNIFVEHYLRGPCKREEEATASAAERCLK